MTEKKSLNQKINDLEAATDWFYSDEFELDEAVKHYRAALELAKAIEKDLNNLKNEVEVLSKDFAE